MVIQCRYPRIYLLNYQKKKKTKKKKISLWRPVKYQCLPVKVQIWLLVAKDLRLLLRTSGLWLYCRLMLTDDHPYHRGLDKSHMRCATRGETVKMTVCNFSIYAFCCVRSKQLKSFYYTQISLFSLWRCFIFIFTYILHMTNFCLETRHICSIGDEIGNVIVISRQRRISVKRLHVFWSDTTEDINWKIAIVILKHTDGAHKV